MNAALCKTAIITGASRVIGATVAQRLASDGFRVVMNYTGDDDQAEARIAGILKAGGSAIAIPADVSETTATRQKFDRAVAEFGGVDVLVNNAGIMQLSTIAQCGDTFFHRHIAINLKGVFNGMREASKRLRWGGRVISFSSSVVGLYQPTYGIYAATQAGVEAMTHVLADELRGRNITVNLIAPGQPTDIAGVVAFLAGPDGAWVNAQVLRANVGHI
jgi:3-oxoacyl-[acyl-carrier protein] reductase